MPSRATSSSSSGPSASPAALHVHESLEFPRVDLSQVHAINITTFSRPSHQCRILRKRGVTRRGQLHGVAIAHDHHDTQPLRQQACLLVWCNLGASSIACGTLFEDFFMMLIPSMYTAPLVLCVYACPEQRYTLHNVSVLDNRSELRTGWKQALPLHKLTDMTTSHEN